MTIPNQFELELPYDDNEPILENWPERPWLLFGHYLEILDLNEKEAEEFRLSTSEFVETNGAE